MQLENVAAFEFNDKELELDRLSTDQQLSEAEKSEIDQKIKYEVSVSFHSMVKLGAFANAIGAFLYLLAIYGTAKPMLIISWYCALVAANLLNVLWAMRFEHNLITQKEIERCRTGILVIISIIALIWGSIGVLFMEGGFTQQLITIIFLSAVLISFTFGTVIDLTMGIACIISVLAPVIFYHLFLRLYLHDISQPNLSIVAAFIVLELFMLFACFLGNMVVIKVFRLGYENVLLSEKLEGLNSVLEQRVKKRTEELENSLKLVTYHATHDVFTQLPNERLLYESIQQATERAVKNHHQFAIACLSINGMIKIKDSIGHQAAATIIQRVAQRFKLLLEDKPHCFISLSRQDVFVILIDSVDDQSVIKDFVSDIFSMLSDPIVIDKQRLQLTGSIGVSMFPASGRNADILITNAESARVLASERGGNNLCFYSAHINSGASRQLTIENELYSAIEKKELLLNYQPFIDVRTGHICGAEALIRWKNQELGWVSPLDFIPIAETNGMIIPIGEWVLSTTCDLLKKIENKRLHPVKISVNLSAKQLTESNITDFVMNTLKKHQLDPKRLELELTESEAFHNEAIPILNKFKELGISLAIDDFGTGYSAFKSLQLFNIDKIKLDRTFIQDIDINIDSRNIVRNTIALAKLMGIDCLAEGVETIEQLKFVQDNGCHIIQGYYFSRPLIEKDFLNFIKKYSATPAPQPGRVT